jgi:hypothetical protein
MRIISLKKQEVQIGQNSSPIIVHQGIVIEAVGLGAALMQSLPASLTFALTKAPPHYIFDGETFKRVNYDKNKTEKIDKIREELNSGKVLCKFGCGNLALYPPGNPQRCCEYAQQCPERKKAASEKMKASTPDLLNAHSGKPLPEKKVEEKKEPKKVSKPKTKRAPKKPKQKKAEKSVEEAMTDAAEAATKEINEKPAQPEKYASHTNQYKSDVEFDFGEAAKQLDSAFNQSVGSMGADIEE